MENNKSIPEELKDLSLIEQMKYYQEKYNYAAREIHNILLNETGMITITDKSELNNL